MTKDTHKSQRFGIIGAGALGLYYGACLQQAAFNVAYLMRRDYDVIKTQGLHVYSINGDFYLAKVAAYASPEAMPPLDVAIIGLKTTANHCLKSLVLPLLQQNPDLTVVTLQNGLGNEEQLAQIMAPEQVFGGVAYLCANRGEPGTVHHLGEGRIQLGALGPNAAKLAPLAAAFKQAGIPCTTTADLAAIRWQKLVWNIPFNGLCALLGCTTSDLLACQGLTADIRQIMHEVIRAANSQDLHEPISAPAYIEQMLTMTAAMDHYKPSMLVDRENGRPLELEAIYGEALRRAEQQGMAMPRTQFLYHLLQQQES